jgi:RNA polymerase sigma factor (sigma-70 family)
MVTEFTDKQLVMGIKERSDDVFLFLDRRYRKAIITKVMEWGGSSTDGEDVFGEGIAGLIELVSKRNFTLSCKMSSLLFQVCKYQWVTVLEKQKSANNYQYRHNEKMEVDESSEEMDRALFRRIYDDCFSRLEKECRQILTAYFKELPPREIAEIFGVSYGNLRRKKSMCHTALVQFVDHHPEYEFLREHEGFQMQLKSRCNE